VISILRRPAQRAPRGLSSRLARSSLALAATALISCATDATDSAASVPEPRAWSSAALPITGTASDHDALVTAVGDARFVLLGESTHGTHEYYVQRSRLTRRLIEERGFKAVAIEGDWSATERVNQYVRGLGTDKTAEQALAGYTGFPRWMWHNQDFRDFVEQLRAFNLARPAAQRVGVYGMDVYDVFDAAKATVRYLRGQSPAAAARAERHYKCFSPYAGSVHAYGEAARHPIHSCQKAAEAVLAEVKALSRPTDPAEADRHFAAVRSATSVAAGEAYFRTVYAGSMSWNVRDAQMARNVEEIAAHVGAASGQPGKVVVWAHNSHSGDARATSVVNRGEHNLGQLLRQRHGAGTFLVGFLSYAGTVTAAPEWDAPGRSYDMKPALDGSDAELFHRQLGTSFSLVLRGAEAVAAEFASERPQRAIGVVYRPDSERLSHYFEARLADQFDALIYVDRSSAVRPLEPEVVPRPAPAGATDLSRV
jgi:erythromycin esterase-like protein